MWDVRGNMLFSYCGPSLPILDQESGELGHEVSCCCFNMQGTALLFNIPYEQVIHGVNNEVFVRESRLLCQRFVVTPDYLTATFSPLFDYHLVRAALALGILVRSWFRYTAIRTHH